MSGTRVLLRLLVFATLVAPLAPRFACRCGDACSANGTRREVSQAQPASGCHACVATEGTSLEARACCAECRAGLAPAFPENASPREDEVHARPAEEAPRPLPRRLATAARFPAEMRHPPPFERPPIYLINASLLI